jgi:hypothetical protein
MIQLPKSHIDCLLKLATGESVPSSSFKGEIVDEMIDNDVIVQIVHGRRKTYKAVSLDVLADFLAANYEIKDLKAYASFQIGAAPSRSTQVAALGNSKAVRRRTMSGFLVNTYEPIKVLYKGKTIELHPYDGTFTFIYDYYALALTADVTIVGVENCENFRWVSRQKNLFKHLGKVLFVCRYPQSGDLIRWLQSIPNRYVHFGDFDLAGVFIYQNEFYNKLGDRASFLVPDDIEARLKSGSRERYDAQIKRYSHMKVTDERLRPIIDLIKKYRRGYEQEGYIGEA